MTPGNTGESRKINQSEKSRFIVLKACRRAPELTSTHLSVLGIPGIP